MAISLYYSLFISTKIIGLFLSIILGFAVVSKYLQYRIKIILLLLGPFLGFFFINVVSLLPNFINNTTIPSAILTSICSGVFFTSILLFFTFFSGERSSLRLSVISAGIVGVLILQIAALVTSQPELVGFWITYEDTVVTEWSGLVRIILLPVFILTGIWSYMDISKSEKNMISKDQLQQLRLMKLGFTSIFIMGIVLNIISNVFSNQKEPLYLWLIHIGLLGIFAPLGVGLISVAYLTTDKAAFLQPVQVNKLLVIHKIGIPLFDYEFITDTYDTETELVSGAIKAITAIMEEAFGVSTDVNLIRFQDKELLVEFQEEVAFILITEKESNFLRKSLIRFKQHFINKYQDDFKDFDGDISKFVDANDLVQLSFGL